MTTASPPEASSGARRVLLVDDNKAGLSARKCVLEEHGYKIVTATSPTEALEVFESCVFDVVVTDYRMPRMNGTELIENLRKLKPDVPVILISGYTEALGLDESNTGADVVLMKSANEVANLVRAVNRMTKKPPKKAAARAQTQLTRAKKAGK